jgi:hypothetical protein
MKFKGIVSITISDSSGNTKSEIIEENLIPDNSWLGILGNNAVRGYFNRSISIATDSTDPIASVSVVGGVIGTCTPVSPTPVWVESSDPPFGTITGRISPTGVTRTFNSVALTGLASGDTQSIASTTAFARLLLSIPCTQTATDFVNITYTIQFLDNIGDGFLSKNLNRYDLGRALFNAGNYNIGNLASGFCNPKYDSIEAPYQIFVLGQSNSNIPSTFWTSSGVSSLNYKWNYQVVRDRNSYLGIIINAMTQGISNSGNRAYVLTKYQYDKEPFQTGFKKTSLSVLPFFDPGNIASSQGRIVIGGTWDKKIPEIYKITFTASGAVGTSTYRFSVLKHTGFDGNTYTHRGQQTLYRTPGFQYISNLHGWRDEDFDVHQLSNTEVVQFDTDGVSVVDIFDGSGRSWDNTSTPSITVSQIRQIAVDSTNRLIYVADRVTGLWIINIDANTVNNQFTQPCYGVDVGRNNVAVTLINGGLHRSTDWGTPASFTFAGITDGNWQRVRFLKADPSHTNDRIAIIADNGSGTNRVVWYQFSDNTSTLGYQDASVRSYAASLDVSDTGHHWVIYRGSGSANRLTYGSATLGTGYTANRRTLTHSVWGSEAFSKVTFFRDNYVAGGALAGGSDVASYPSFTFTDDFGTPNQTALALHLEGGVFLADKSGTRLGNIAGYVAQILPSIAEVSYGWNGSNWVVGNTSSKATHLSADTLLNGLTIRFENGANPPHFVNTEVFTQSINYGLLKDNATSIEIRTAWYSKTIHNDTISATPITATVTLPAASSPVFRRVDTDVNSPHRIFIDGVLVTKLWLNGELPAPTEASFPSSGAATLSFNTADLGKTLTGSYLWLEA